jgi:chorismate mutase
MSIRSLRGAITVPENSRQAIRAATTELLQALIDSNGLQAEQVVSAVFSATPDLNAAYPAEAARALGWTRAGLMCVQEMRVDGSLSMCLRVLVLLETDRGQREMVHCYLRGAQNLRPDLK